MKTKQIIEVRKLAKVTRAEWSRATGIPLRTLEELEAGRNGATAAVRLLYRILKAHPEIVAELVANQS